MPNRVYLSIKGTNYQSKSTQDIPICNRIGVTMDWTMQMCLLLQSNGSNRNKEKNDHPVHVEFELYFHKEYLLWAMGLHFHLELGQKIANFLTSNHSNSNSNNVVLNVFSFELAIGRLKNIKPCLISTFAKPMLSNIVKDQIGEGAPENEKRQRSRQTKHKLTLSDDSFEKKRRRLNNENEMEKNNTFIPLSIFFNNNETGG